MKKNCNKKTPKTTKSKESLKKTSAAKKAKTGKNSSRIPEGVSEAYVLEAIEQAVQTKAHKFVFGYFSKECMEQEARLMAWVALEKYDTGGIGDDGLPKRPLVNFLCRCLHSRLCNFMRDNLRRNDAPCKICHGGTPCEKSEDGRNPCERYARWKELNDRKAHCMETFSILESDDKPSGEIPECELAMQVEEFYQLVDEYIPADLREDYLRLKSGQKIHHGKRKVLEEIFRKILQIESGDSE